MNLNDNPIFLDAKTPRASRGVLAAILIAALIGLSLLSGLIAYLAEPQDFGFHSSQEAGKMFYGWTIGVEILVLIIGGFSGFRARWPTNARPALGQQPADTAQTVAIVTGYWLGSASARILHGARCWRASG